MVQDADELARLQGRLAESQRLLAISDERFRNVIARMADGVVVVDHDGLVLFVNPAAAELFRRPVPTLLGVEFGFPTVGGETIELDIPQRDGSVTVAEMRCVETEWEGQPAFLATLRDVTERRRMEEARMDVFRAQAAQAEAEAAVRMRDEFLSVASHELKTPITSLVGYVQLLQRLLQRDGVLEAPVVERALRTLDSQSTRLARLVAQLLDVSRVESGTLVLEPTALDLVPLLERLAQTAQASGRGHVVVTQARGPLWAWADPMRIEQVLASLLDNAVRYSDEGSRVEVRAQATDARTLRVEVRDQGSGIPVEMRAEVFQRFHRAHGHAAGLGLSLYISRQIVDLHGGRLWAEFPPRGSLFVLELPQPPVT